MSDLRSRSARLHLLATGPDYEPEDVPPTVAAVASAQAVVDVYESTSAEDGAFNIFPDYEGGVLLITSGSKLVRSIEIDESGSRTARDTERGRDRRSFEYTLPDARTAAAFLGACA